MHDYEPYLTRWRNAGVLDEASASAIRRYEQSQSAPSGQRWQVIVALILGGILLGAGVLLFVAAHWDDVSPGTRLTLVLGMLAIFHLAGILSRERFAGFATTMHALGTVASGAAIALVGQIFNMQEHWPSAVMLWAMCAVAGWALLRDQFQETLALLLVPAWLISEWAERAGVYNGSDVSLWRTIAVLSTVYLTVYLHSQKRVVFGILFGVAGVALAVATVQLSEGWSWIGYRHNWGPLPLSLQLSAYAMVALSLGFAWLLSRKSIVPVALVALVTFALPWLNIARAENGSVWKQSEPSLAMYALVAAMCVFLAGWGVREASRAMINYGIVAFALTVVWFYFSSVMDKLGRSMGLILLGVLFLAGGWTLETMRRRLVASIPEVSA